MDSTNSTQFSRRRFLQATGATAAAGLLAGCTTGTEDDTTPRSTSTAPNTIVETPSETEPLEQTHAVEDLDTVAQELEQDAVSLNFHPADPDAEYADSVLFTEYSGELDVKIDLDHAITHRHKDIPWSKEKGRDGYHVIEFIENISQQNTDWIKQVNQKFAESNGNEHLPGLRDEVDFETYNNKNLDFETRMSESGIYDLWTKHEIVNLPGGGGSELNQFMAAALQGTETEAGFNTVVWDYNIPGHGLAGAIENPTRNPENTDQQETYVLETDDRAKAEQRIQTWQDSPYRTGDGIAPHDAHKNNHEKNIYLDVSFYNFDNGKIRIENEQVLGEKFDEFYREPNSIPAYNLLDPLMAAEYIDDTNTLTTTLSKNQITISPRPKED